MKNDLVKLVEDTLSESKLQDEFQEDVKEDVKEDVQLNERFHTKDELLQGITFEELIITVQSNESESKYDKATVTKVFNEILKMKLDDAKYELKSKMSHILKNL